MIDSQKRPLHSCTKSCYTYYTIAFFLHTKKLVSELSGPEPNLDHKFIFPVGLAPNGILFDKIQSEGNEYALNLFWQYPEMYFSLLMPSPILWYIFIRIEKHYPSRYYRIRIEKNYPPRYYGIRIEKHYC